MKNYRIIFLQTFILIFSRQNIRATLFSFFLSLSLIAVLLFCFWNLLPSISWMKVLFYGVYDYLFNLFWFFIITSSFIYLFPPISTLVSGFFLEKVVDNVNRSLGSYADFKLEGDGYLSGIIAGIRILGFSTIVFILIMIFKWLFVSSIILSIILQFVASSLIIGREYYEIISIKYFTAEESKRFKRKNYLNILIVGMFCNLFFLIPLLNLIAPIISTIFMTLRFNQLRLKSLNI